MPANGRDSPSKRTGVSGRKTASQKPTARTPEDREAGRRRETVLRQWQMLGLIPKAPKSISTAALHLKLQDRGHIVSKRTVERNLSDLMFIFPLRCETSGNKNTWCWLAETLPHFVSGISGDEAMLFVLAEMHLKRLLPSQMFLDLSGHFDAAKRKLRSLEPNNPSRRLFDRILLANGRTDLLQQQLTEQVREAVISGLLSQRKVRMQCIDRQSRSVAAVLVASIQGLVQRLDVLVVVVLVDGEAAPTGIPTSLIGAAELTEETAQFLENIDLARAPIRT